MDLCKQKILDAIAASELGQFKSISEFQKFACVHHRTLRRYLADDDLKRQIETRIKSPETAYQRLIRELPNVRDREYANITALVRAFGVGMDTLERAFKKEPGLRRLCMQKVRKKPVSVRLQRKLKEMSIYARGLSMPEIASACSVTLSTLTDQCEISDFTQKLVDKITRSPEKPIPKTLMQRGIAWCMMGSHHVSLVDLVEGKAICHNCYPVYAKARKDNELAIQRQKQLVQSLRKTG